MPPTDKPAQNGTNAVVYPRTAEEMQAEVAPTLLHHAELDVRRYGADVHGDRDSSEAFRRLFAVMLQHSGAVAYLHPGIYRLDTEVVTPLTPTRGPSSATRGFTLFAYGAVVNFSGAGYAFDFQSPNTSAAFYHPQLALYGLNIVASGKATGGIRVSDLSTARLVDCTVQNATNAPAYTLRNSTSWCENCHFIGCAAVNCQTGIAFVVAGGQNSFARTKVESFFGAGISQFFFDVGPGCSVYDSRFTHISGNFTGLAYFGVGAADRGADMTATVVDGIDTEVNAARAGQSVFRLRDYPRNSGNSRRPVVYNVGAFATNSGSLPMWADNKGNPVSLEEIQRQPLIAQTGLRAYEPNRGQGSSVAVATQDSAIVSNISLTGFRVPPSGRVTFSRSGNIARLRVLDPLTGTSDENRMTLTTVPTEFRPSDTRLVPCFVVDNGTEVVPAMASIGSTGVITFWVATAFNSYSSTGFTPSGSKGLLTGLDIGWSLA